MDIETFRPRDPDATAFRTCTNSSCVWVAMWKSDKIHVSLSAYVSMKVQVSACSRQEQEHPCPYVYEWKSICTYLCACACTHKSGGPVCAPAPVHIGVVASIAYNYMYEWERVFTWNCTSFIMLVRRRASRDRRGLSLSHTASRSSLSLPTRNTALRPRVTAVYTCFQFWSLWSPT